MITPALDILRTKTAAGIGQAIRTGLGQAWQKDPASTLMAGATALGAVSSVASPVIANLTAPGAPRRHKDQTGSYAPMPAG